MRHFVLGMLLALPTGAQAQWIYHGEESAFGDGGNHFAAVANGSYIFGIRCENGAPLAIYLTPEDITNDDAQMMSFLSIEMLMRVDSNEPHRISAEVESFNGRLRVIGGVETKFAEELAAADTRVAVAFSFGGEMFHESSFGVSGSTNVARLFMADCVN